MQVIREISINSKPKESFKPKVIQWNKQDMVLVHSPNAVAEQITKRSKGLDFVKVSIIGNQGTGKTELSMTLAHLIHEKAKKLYNLSYAVKIFGKKQLLRLEETLSNLSPTNYILIFDDIGFLKGQVSPQQMEQIKDVVSRIRHLPGGQDVKIIEIDNFHYTLGHDKYLRQADFHLMTSVGSSENENVERMFGFQFMPVVKEFQQITRQAYAGDNAPFIYRIGKNSWHTYYRDNPFRPAIFFDGDFLRHIVFPLRTWIDPLCTICHNSNEGVKTEGIDLAKWKAENETRFGKKAFKMACKMALLQNGINTCYPNQARAIKFLHKEFGEKNISFEDLMQIMGLKLNFTQLRGINTNVDKSFESMPENQNLNTN